jgi:hypothetical protein
LVHTYECVQPDISNMFSSTRAVARTLRQGMLKHPRDFLNLQRSETESDIENIVLTQPFPRSDFFTKNGSSYKTLLIEAVTATGKWLAPIFLV